MDAERRAAAAKREAYCHIVSFVHGDRFVVLFVTHACDYWVIACQVGVGLDAFFSERQGVWMVTPSLFL